jgi:hypothetical protein
MPAKREQQTRRVRTRLGIPVDESWRQRIRQPKITDPKQREEAIDRATSLIKTTVQVDTTRTSAMTTASGRAPHDS